MSKSNVIIILLCCLVVALLLYKGGSRSTPIIPDIADDDWVYQPMEELTFLSLLVEEGSVSQTLERFVPQIRMDLNIELHIDTVPFKEKLYVQVNDMEKDNDFDLYLTWPCYIADFQPYLLDLAEVAPGGIEQVKVDLNYDDIHPSYLWGMQYRGNIYGTLIDGDVKLLNYRYDLANDPREKAAFFKRYGYPLEMDHLTWETYLDVAEFFTRPEQGFYGTVELATFFSYFYFMDRYLGMGGHLFSYEDMTPFPDKELAIKAMQHGKDTFDKYSPPGAKSFVVEDIYEQLWIEKSVFMMVFWPDAWRIANNPKTSNLDCQISVAPIPRGMKNGGDIFRSNLDGCRTLVINKNSSHKIAAYKVLAFFAEDDIADFLVNNKNSWLDPWRKSQLNEIKYNYLCPQKPYLRQKYVEVIKTSIDHGYPAIQIPGISDYHDDIEKWTSKAWQGELTAEEAVDGIINELNITIQERGYEQQLKEWRYFVDHVLRPLNVYP